MIVCKKCGELKEEIQYSFRNKAKGKRHTQCKNCIQEKIHQNYLNNKEKYKDRVKKWVENNKDQRTVNFRNSYAYNKGYKRCNCCTKEDINQFLKNCPKDCEVDHIKTIRQQGTHCLKNLRYLTISCHARKSQWERYNT